MKKTINVTERDIRCGVRKSGFSCPIAKAIKRSFKKGSNALNLWVCPSYITIKNVETIYNRGNQLYDFMINFDKGLPVTPFSFELIY